MEHYIYSVKSKPIEVNFNTTGNHLKKDEIIHPCVALKRIFLFFSIILFIFSGCKRGTSNSAPISASDILEKYRDYPVALNKAGISISISNTNDIIIQAKRLNANINDLAARNGANMDIYLSLMPRLKVFNAEDITQSKEFQINIQFQQAEMEFLPVIDIPKNEKSGYVLIYFKGITKEESELYETGPLFFLVELNNSKSIVLTNIPLLADKLIEQTGEEELVSSIIDEDSEENEQIYTNTNVPPSFPGGEAELLKWLGNNIKYPTLAVEQEIQGTVILKFVINVDGSIRDISVERSLETNCDKEAIRVVQSMPKWLPAQIIKGDIKMPVASYHTLSIGFRLSN